MTQENTDSIYENDLIEALADSFSMAVEFLDADTIVKCLKIVLEKDLNYYESMYKKYKIIASKIQ